LGFVDSIKVRNPAMRVVTVGLISFNPTRTLLYWALRKGKALTVGCLQYNLMRLSPAFEIMRTTTVRKVCIVSNVIMGTFSAIGSFLILRLEAA
jgi:hypothetical protein